MDAKVNDHRNNISSNTDFNFTDTITSFSMDADFVDFILNNTPSTISASYRFFKAYATHSTPHAIVNRSLLLITILYSTIFMRPV